MTTLITIIAFAGLAVSIAALALAIRNSQRK